MLTAHMLGGFSLLDGNGRDVPLRSRKARALLGYLLVSGGAPARREKLAGLLWSESSSDQAFDSLRHCVSELRRTERTGGLQFLQADRDSIRVDRSKLRTDLDELKTRLASGEVGACRHLLTKPHLALLAGAEADDPVFDNWLLVERERQGEALVQDMLAILRRGDVDARDRTDLVRAIEQLDPYQEDAVRIHMELLAAEGNVVGATAFFERYRTRLSREYDVEPSEELVEFAETLAKRTTKPAQAVEPPAASQPAPLQSTPLQSVGALGKIPTIAVLRLPGSPGADQLDQWAGAFCRELVSALSRFKEWSVVASGAEPMLFDGGQANPLAELASMSVDYALIASLSEVAGSRAINVRLMECATRSLLVSDQYPADSDNWPVVFNDICCRIASRIQISIATTRLRSVADRSSTQRQAYDLWLEGEMLTWLWQPDTEKRAVELFQAAIALDGRLACAYASWASVLNTRWIICPGWPEDATDLEQAYQLAKRAVALDPLDCRNHIHLGWSHLLARRFEPGELHFQLAHDLNPSSPDNLIGCGLANSFCGYHERAKALCDRALALNPLRPTHYWSYRASVELLARNYEACIAAVAMVPDFIPDIQGWAAVAHAHLGQKAEAAKALERFYGAVRKQWHGKPRPSDADLRRWFVAIFPIKRAEDRKLLADGMAKMK
jgi:DNA-binding SARP family transcriptional activator/tetratricopeptide (TPR) repeat protein